MSELSDLKKQMVRSLVRENVAHVRDGPRGARPARLVRVKRTLVGVLPLIFVPLILFVSINGVSSGGTASPEVLVVDSGPSPAPETLRAPKRIDPNVFRLQIGTVVVDAGHGGSDPGALTEDGLAEKDVTLGVALRLQRLLVADGLTVVMTRQTDRRLTLKERAGIANAAGADLFISIHVNSIPSPDRRGVETYFPGEAQTPQIEQLAGAENQESGYSLADFRTLLEGVYAGVRQSESKRLADAVQKNLFNSLKRVNPQLEDRGVKTAPFVVLAATEMPGILAEVSCVSNPAEALLLRDPGYIQEIAAAIHQGVRAYGTGRIRDQKAKKTIKLERRGS